MSPPATIHLPFSNWRTKETADRLLKAIEAETRNLPTPLKLMEICGTHTMTLHRSGLKPRLRQVGIDMISGPGCPVCITPDYYHEAIIDLLVGRGDILVCTFGDMTRVPTRKGSLQTVVPAPGSRLKIVYSPEEAVAEAHNQPEKQVIFFGAGFETTIPGITFTVKKADEEKLKNYCLLTAFWLIPPALKAIIEGGELAINGFIYPGHVSAIIGEKPYALVAETYHLPGAIAGFEPADILLGILSVVKQIRSGQPLVANEYRRVVKPEGNVEAQAIMERYLIKTAADWRGLGPIPDSGLKLRPEYSSFDAVRRFSLKLGSGSSARKTACRCGEVLKGLIAPTDCPLFGRQCRPDSPQGPCMVSYEGACLIEYKFSGVKSYD